MCSGCFVWWCDVWRVWRVCLCVFVCLLVMNRSVLRTLSPRPLDTVRVCVFQSLSLCVQGCVGESLGVRICVLLGVCGVVMCFVVLLFMLCVCVCCCWQQLRCCCVCEGLRVCTVLCMCCRRASICLQLLTENQALSMSDNMSLVHSFDRAPSSVFSLPNHVWRFDGYAMAWDVVPSLHWRRSALNEMDALP